MLTPMMKAASEKVKASLLADVVAPKRMGDPKEFALTVKFLIENAYMNAQVVRCDGGVACQTFDFDFAVASSVASQYRRLRLYMLCNASAAHFCAPWHCG